MDIKRICVYCGASPGSKPDYMEAATALGKEIARRGQTLVFGGGRVGLMGTVGRAVLENGGEVIGVIPEALANREVAWKDLPDLRVTANMHERKAMMAELSDAFIALPGGLGTLDEFFEALTWAQLSIHLKPCGLLNVCGYYDRLIDFMHVVSEEKFIHKSNLDLLISETTPVALLDRMAAYVPTNADKLAWAVKMTDDMA